MNAFRLLHPRFSLRTLLVFVVLTGFMSAWVARAERQRKAVVALRGLGEYNCGVFYSYHWQGACAHLLSPKREPGWVAKSAGVDFFYSVTQIDLDTSSLDAAIAHLRSLRSLQRIYVSAMVDGDCECDRADADDAANAAIEYLRRELPRVEVEQHPGCPISVSSVPVVG